MRTDVYTPVIAPDSPMTALGRLAGGGFIHQKTGYLPWRVLGQYALVYVLEGRGQYQDANGLISEIAAGDLLLLFPELAHRYGPGSRGTWTELHMIFEGRMFEEWRDIGLLDSSRPLYHLEPVEQWQARFLEIAPDSGIVAVSRLLTVLTEAAATRSITETPSPLLPWLTHARNLLETELSEERPMTEVAAHLSLSYETFRKAFEQQVGISPARYRAGKRMDAARALLLHTPMTSRQIADSLGFPDEFYFSKRFKQAVGLSPRDFRRLQAPDGR